MKIKKGNYYLCIKEVIMSDGDIAYSKGATYYSEIDTWLTDNQGCIDHYWDNDLETEKYFKLWDKNKSNFRTYSEDTEKLMHQFCKDYIDFCKRNKDDIIESIMKCSTILLKKDKQL